MKRAKKNIYKKFGYIGIVALFLLFFSYFYVLHQFNKPLSDNGQLVVFVVEPGEGVRQISQKLKNDNLIRSDKFFNLYVWLKNEQGNLKAGNYELNSSFPVSKIFDILINGRTIDNEITIKIIEGWNIDNIEEYFEKSNLSVGKDLRNLANRKVKNWEFDFVKYDFLDDVPANANLEGFLFPDTYRIYNDATPESVINKMLDNFDQKITQDMYNDIEKSSRSIFEIITMASIIEKEVRNTEDMKLVSGIFWDRIKNGQPLESCATLAYVLGENKKQYTLEDTKVDSLYNTYQNRGLPPGPICNPGLNAILAAIYPKYSDYNYFLSRFDNGETVFSKTYEEHINNKNKYLR